LGVGELATGMGVRMLRNELVDIDGLQIAGLDDLWAGQFHPRRVLPDLDRNRAALVLSHNPDSADQLGWDPFVGWILSGHTHGGQCKPPFLPPPLLPVKNRLYRAGEYRLGGGRRMYINRGLGHLLQVRFNVRPEVTVFRLARELGAGRVSDQLPVSQHKPNMTVNSWPSAPVGATVLPTLL
jgi:predicted MPP superfamily phosphohydrolase